MGVLETCIWVFWNRKNVDVRSGSAAGRTGNSRLLWALCYNGCVYWERVTLMGILELWLGVLEHVYMGVLEKNVMGILHLCLGVLQMYASVPEIQNR